MTLLIGQKVIERDKDVGAIVRFVCGNFVLLRDFYNCECRLFMPLEIESIILKIQ